MPDESDISAVRRGKLAALRERGLAYPNGFERTALAAELHATHADADKATLEAEPKSATVAGRIMLRRVMGRASFITLQDGSGRMQCYLRSDDIGAAAYADFRELYDIGDIVGVAGTLMRTNRGELTVAAAKIRRNPQQRPLGLGAASPAGRHIPEARLEGIWRKRVRHDIPIYGSDRMDRTGGSARKDVISVRAGTVQRDRVPGPSAAGQPAGRGTLPGFTTRTGRRH